MAFWTWGTRSVMAQITLGGPGPNGRIPRTSVSVLEELGQFRRHLRQWFGVDDDRRERSAFVGLTLDEVNLARLGIGVGVVLSGMATANFLAV